jgi:hypothetical protein
MHDVVPSDMSNGPRRLFGSGFVSNGWAGATLEEGPGMIVFGLVMGAFCGLLLGLITMQVVRFFSYSVGRNFGGVTWALICMALGAMAFGVMTLADRD